MKQRPPHTSVGLEGIHMQRLEMNEYNTREVQEYMKICNDNKHEYIYAHLGSHEKTSVVRGDSLVSWKTLLNLINT